MNFPPTATPCSEGSGLPHDPGRHRRPLTSTIAALVALLLGFATLIAGGAPAQADERPPIITLAEFRSSENGAAITSADAGTAGGLYIEYDLDAKGYKSGDTLQYVLPHNFNPSAPNNTTFTFEAVYEGVSHRIGTATYYDRKILVVLSAGVEELDGIHGHFWIGGSYWGTEAEPDLTLNPGTANAYTIRMTRLGGPGTPGVGPLPEHGKYASFKDGSNNTVIKYAVGVNLDSRRAFVAGSVVADRANGLIVNPATLTVSVRNPTTTLTPGQDYTADFFADGSGFTITLLTDIRDEFWLTYESSVFEVADVYRNDVTATIPGNPGGGDAFGHDVDWTDISGSAAGHLRDLTLVKKDQDSHEPLAGAVFDLYRKIDGSDRLLRTGLTTGDDGKLVAKDLLSGEYTLVEVTPPTGYTAVAGVDRISVTLPPQQSADVEVDFYNKMEAIPPGAVELMKVDGSDAPLAGAEFTIHDDTGTLLKSRITDSDGALKFSHLAPGTYTVTETRAPDGFDISAEARAGYRVTVVSGETARVRGSGSGGTVVNFPTQNAPEPTVQTSATNKATGGKRLPAAGGTVSDLVTYTGLVPGLTYTLRGELMDKATGASTGITASTQFVPLAPDGQQTLDFIVGNGHADKRVVVFERLFAEVDDTNPIASHEDIDSDEQTITIDSPPAVQTTATNKATGGKRLPAAGGTVSDLVTYTGLVPGLTYTLRGELMDKATGASTGITASTQFVPLAPDGQQTLDFIVGNGHADKRVVVFERLFAEVDDTNPIASHEDIDSDEQTITIDSPPAVKTTATNKATGGKRLPYIGGTITDIVAYTGLTTGAQYTLVGQLMEAHTGRAVPGSSRSITFTPAAASGMQALDLTVPAGHAGTKIVVYEYLYAEDGTTLVAEHTELGDAGQTVTIDADPTIATTATNRDDGSHTLPYDGGVITDEVRYTGLVPGVQYTIRGELMDKATRRSAGIRSADHQFTPVSASGTVSIDFTVDSSFAGRTLVAYEWLYRGSSLEAQHTDIDSVEQTVVVAATPTIATTATNGDTGDKTPLLFDGGVVVDEVRYTGLTPGQTYTIRGELMAKEVDETTGQSAVIATGIVAEAPFQPESADGSVSLEFEVDGSHAGTMLVAFEKLFDADGKLVAQHEEIESTEQTVTVGAVPSLATTATNKDDGGKLLEFQGGTITDVVEYTNVIPGVELTLAGELFDKATGESMGITATRTFVPDTAAGSIELDFVVPSGFAGTRLVAFETLKERARVIATHHDIDSEEQAVDVRSQPTVSTSAADGADGDKQLAELGGTVVDTVYYTGLIPGREYVVNGELMRKADGTSTGLTASRTFVPTTADGAVDLELVVPAGYRDTWLVVFETVLDCDLVVAEHTDIESEPQTIFVDHSPEVVAPAGIASTGSSILGPLAWAVSLLAAGSAGLLTAIRLRNRRAIG
ncbi:VaFE repeat-containing surface-anchored protein [Leifsonia sp. McL0607]|uniref:VaFE repeat-containing surface-anchored protein n=1 Tax=Leifsonia sp. McL0607 TaxID=3415672 RepID=UPI003CF54AE3